MPIIELRAHIPDLSSLLEKTIHELGGKARLSQILERITWQHPSRKDLFGDTAFAAVVILDAEDQFRRLDEAPGDWWTVERDAVRSSDE